MTASRARDLARLLVPVQCAGCGAADVAWCEDCRSVWRAPYRTQDTAGRLDIIGASPLPLWTLATLDGPAHEAIAAWKDAHRRDLDAFFAGAMRRAGQSLAHVCPTATAVVVPAPARPAGTRRRGVDLPRLLARSFATGLRDAGLAARVDSLLSTTGHSSRAASARRRWRDVSITARRDNTSLVAAWMIDDVATTGATLAACASALEDVNVVPMGAVVLATAAQVGNSLPEV